MLETLADGITRRRTLAMLAGAACAGSSALTAKAAGPVASAWSDSSHSRMRLVRGSGGKAGEYRVGILFDLKPGYKTYWRHPGDSGVPPVFRFEGSQNLKEAKVHFPAPKRFPDGAGGFSNGYAGPELILPVTVQAQNPREPVILSLDSDYAVCEKLCVLAQGKANLTLTPDGSSSAFDEPLARAMARVPAPLALGGTAPLSVKSLAKGREPEHFLVHTTAPAGDKAELFVEAPSPWFFDVKAAENGVFSILVVEKDKAPDCTGADIALTLVSSDSAIEVRTRLDMALIAS